MDRYNYELTKAYIESHLDAAARELEMHPAESAAALLRAVPLELGQRAITQMLPAYGARIVAMLDAEAAAALLTQDNSSKVAAILRQLPVATRAPILLLLPERLATRCRRSLQHPENSVGAWMSMDTPLLPQNLTAAAALERIAAAIDLGDGNAIPLVDESWQLGGYVSIADLLRARGDTPLGRLRREPQAGALSAKMSLRRAEHHPGWQLFDVLVVVNQQGQVDGMLRYAALRKGLQVTAQADAASKTEAPIAGGLGEVYLHALVSMYSLISGESSVPANARAERVGARP